MSYVPGTELGTISFSDSCEAVDAFAHVLLTALAIRQKFELPFVVR